VTTDESSVNAPGQPVAEELPSGSPVEALEAALGVIPPRPQLPLPRWLGPLAVCCTVGIVPWIVYLGLTLPDQQHTDHYAMAWLGFDSGMCVVLAALCYCAIKRKPATELLAAVAATLLVVDAWFDVVTSEDLDAFWLALTTALLAELPLAVICAWVAVNAERVRSRAYRRLRSRWQRAGEIARSAELDQAGTESSIVSSSCKPLTGRTRLTELTEFTELTERRAAPAWRAACARPHPSHPWGCSRGAPPRSTPARRYRGAPRARRRT
jgi:hypothetical protein